MSAVRSEHKMILPTSPDKMGQPEPLPLPPDEINVSLGTAGVLGLLSVAQEVPPTTGYLMVGGRCRRDCSFCAQARTSHARANALSRITWPPQDLDLTIARIAEAYGEGLLQRCCLQVTVTPGYLTRAEYLLNRLHEACQVPLSLSIVPRSLDDVRRLFAAGAQRIGLALDAATPLIYWRVKGPGWERTLSLLEAAGRDFPGRISTHLIVGLGETEAEMVSIFQRLVDQGILVGLFAFTPVPGTRLEITPPPSLSSYRRLQAARFLITGGHIRVRDLTFDANGRILGFGLLLGELQDLLGGGTAFQTSGCPGCNRPYYNERPGGVMYNYPRPLSRKEVTEATAILLARP